MMQPSDLDRERLTIAPKHSKPQHGTVVGKVPSHLSAVPTKPSHKYAVEPVQPESDTGKPQMKPADVSNQQEDKSPEIGDVTAPNPQAIASRLHDIAQNNGHQEPTPSVVDQEASGSGNPENPALKVAPAVASTEQEPGFAAVLSNRNFLALWSGQVFCQLADKVYLVLMIALIDTQFQTGEQTISGWVSALMMAFTIPAVLFGSVAGVFVDRWSKKTVLVGTNILRGALVLAIPPLLWLTHDWSPIGMLPVGFLIILGVTFLVSTLTQFFAPAEQAAMPLLVEHQDLLSANSLYTTTMMASVIVGFAVGEPVLAIADSIWQHLGGDGGLGKALLVGGSYAIAGIILLLLNTKEKTHPPETEFPHVFADLRDGLRYLGENQRIRNALIQQIILFSVFAALAVLAVRMAEVIPGIKASQFGFLLAAGGVGIALGALVLAQFLQRISHNNLSVYGSIGMAASLIGLSVFTNQLWAALLLVLLLGLFASLVAIPMQTTIQKETPADMRGKVFGLQNNVTNIALSLPLALAGVAETFVGLQAVFLGLAAIVICGGVLNWYICRK